MRSGNVEISTGQVLYASAGGYSWTAYASLYQSSTIANAYSLGISEQVVNASNPINGRRRISFPLRRLQPPPKKNKPEQNHHTNIIILPW